MNLDAPPPLLVSVERVHTGRRGLLNLDGLIIDHDCPCRGETRMLAATVYGTVALP
jgi:hypothetical protein